MSKNVRKHIRLNRADLDALDRIAKAATAGNQSEVLRQLIHKTDRHFARAGHYGRQGQQLARAVDNAVEKAREAAKTFGGGPMEKTATIFESWFAPSAPGSAVLRGLWGENDE